MALHAAAVIVNRGRGIVQELGDGGGVAHTKTDQSKNAELGRQQLTSFRNQLMPLFQQGVETLHKMGVDVQEGFVEIFVEPLLCVLGGS